MFNKSDKSLQKAGNYQAFIGKWNNLMENYDVLTGFTKPY